MNETKNTLIRREHWGSICYSKQNDEFWAYKDNENTHTLLRKPLSVGWLITSKCDFKCIHCYGNCEDISGSELSTVECLRLLDIFKNNQIMRIAISGGEPLLRNDLFLILQQSFAYNFGIVLSTNGILVKDDHFDVLKKCTRVEISLDASNSKTHTQIRIATKSPEDSWNELIEIIKNCRIAGIKIRILTTINALNQYELVELFNIINAFNIDEWGISWVLPIGRAKSVYNKIKPSTEVVNKQMDFILKENSKLTIRYSCRGDDFSKYYFLVFPNGQIGTEDLISGEKKLFGSVFNNEISKIWNNDNFNISQHYSKWIRKSF